MVTEVKLLKKRTKTLVSRIEHATRSHLKVTNGSFLQEEEVTVNVAFVTILICLNFFVLFDIKKRNVTLKPIIFIHGSFEHEVECF